MGADASRPKQALTLESNQAAEDGGHEQAQQGFSMWKHIVHITPNEGLRSGRLGLRVPSPGHLYLTQNCLSFLGGGPTQHQQKLSHPSLGGFFTFVQEIPNGTIMARIAGTK